MNRILLIGVLVLTLTLIIAAPTFAHSAHPCADSGEPGNSDYAQHHIVALAKDGALGNDGHKPGEHRGFSLCLGVHD